MSDDTETGPQLLARLGMDAEKWCAEMVKRGVVQADAEPGGWFHGWMCNAIMSAYDRGYSLAQREVRADLALFDKRSSWADKLASLRALRRRAWWRFLDRTPA